MPGVEIFQIQVKVVTFKIVLLYSKVELRSASNIKSYRDMKK